MINSLKTGLIMHLGFISCRCLFWKIIGQGINRLFRPYRPGKILFVGAWIIHARKELNSGQIVQFGMILSTSIINKQ